MGSMSGGPIRVVLVDDDPLVRAGLSLMLGGAPHLEIVGEAGDGAEGLEVIARTRPDGPGWRTAAVLPLPAPAAVPA